MVCRDGKAAHGPVTPFASCSILPIIPNEMNSCIRSLSAVGGVSLSQQSTSGFVLSNQFHACDGYCDVTTKGHGILGVIWNEGVEFSLIICKFGELGRVAAGSALGSPTSPSLCD